MVVARRGSPMGSSAVAPPPPLFSSMADWGAIRRAAVPRRRQSGATPVSTLGDAGSTAGGGRGLLRSDHAELKGGGGCAWLARVGSTAWVAALVSSGEWEGGGWRPLDFRCTAEIFTVYVATLLGLDLMRESCLEITQVCWQRSLVNAVFPHSLRVPVSLSMKALAAIPAARNTWRAGGHGTAASCHRRPHFPPPLPDLPLGASRTDLLLQLRPAPRLGEAARGVRVTSPDRGTSWHWRQ